MDNDSINQKREMELIRKKYDNGWIINVVEVIEH